MRNIIGRYTGLQLSSREALCLQQKALDLLGIAMATLVTPSTFTFHLSPHASQDRYLCWCSWPVLSQANPLSQEIYIIFRNANRGVEYIRRGGIDTYTWTLPTVFLPALVFHSNRNFSFRAQLGTELKIYIFRLKVFIRQVFFSLEINVNNNPDICE